MFRKNSPKKALVASILMLAICITSLVGTTFAWFTDSVSSGSNVIKAGTLDIVLEYWNGTEWVDAEGKVLEFQKAGNANEEVLWEPGCTYQMPKFRVRNVGNLASKILIKLNGVTGNEKLMEAIELSNTITNIPDSCLNGSAGTVFQKFNNATIGLVYGTPDGTIIFDWSLAGAGKVTPNTGTTDTSPEFTISGHMKEEAGNEYQGLMIQGISVTVIAAQEVFEYDSFGREYDKIAPFPTVEAPATVVANAEMLEAALEQGLENIALSDNILVTEAVKIGKNTNINGNGKKILRATTTTYSRSTETVSYTGNVFEVAEGTTLELENIVIDGGAVWTGEIDPVLQRGTVNIGAKATGTLVSVAKNANLILGEGAILQNNDGANAVHLGTRTGGTLTINGGEIINNSSAAGAIWGGGEITINSGKVNGNYGQYGGAIRVVTKVGTVLTMNGGEMNHNYSEQWGGAIWAGKDASTNVYVLNGGEMAYNYSEVAGGAMAVGRGETLKIGGDFKLHDNKAPVYQGIRFLEHSGFEMTGGHIYNNGEHSLFMNSVWATISGGTVSDKLIITGGVDTYLGSPVVEGNFAFDLATTHNTVKLLKEFGEIKFTVNESASNFAKFNFSPAADYVYTEGDEDKLICLNEGYETYWDAASGTFKLQKTN